MSTPWCLKRLKLVAAKESNQKLRRGSRSHAERLGFGWRGLPQAGGTDLPIQIQHDSGHRDGETGRPTHHAVICGAARLSFEHQSSDVMTVVMTVRVRRLEQVRSVRVPRQEHHEENLEHGKTAL
jgi:hypothetical protein